MTRWSTPRGKPVKIEFLLAQTEFERILLPFKRNLSDLGIDLQIRRVDTSQYLNRLRSRDYDMIVGSFPQSSSPGSEHRYWELKSLTNPAAENFIGLKDPAIDQLTEGLINAESRRKPDQPCQGAGLCVAVGLLRDPQLAYQTRARGLPEPYRPSRSYAQIRYRHQHLVGQT